MKIGANLPMEFKNSGLKIHAAIVTSIAQEDARSSFRSINANSVNDAISCMIIERSQKLYNKITQQLGHLFV